MIQTHHQQDRADGSPDLGDYLEFLRTKAETARDLKRSAPRRAVGRFLASLRRAAGYSTTSLAAALRWKQPQVSRLEGSAGGMPNLDTITRYAAGSGAELSLVARDCKGEFHVVSITSDLFADLLAERLSEPTPDATDDGEVASPVRKRMVAV